MTLPRAQVTESTRGVTVPPPTSAAGGMVVASRRGPVEVPVLHSTETGFKRAVTSDGRVRIDDDNSIHEAISYLKIASSLYTVRPRTGAKLGSLIFRRGSNAAYINGVSPQVRSLRGGIEDFDGFAFTPREAITGTGAVESMDADTDSVTLAAASATFLATLRSGDLVTIDGTTLPDGLTAGTRYFVNKDSDGRLRFYSTANVLQPLTTTTISNDVLITNVTLSANAAQATTITTTTADLFGVPVSFNAVVGDVVRFYQSGNTAPTFPTATAGAAIAVDTEYEIAAIAGSNLTLRGRGSNTANIEFTGTATSNAVLVNVTLLDYGVKANYEQANEDVLLLYGADPGAWNNSISVTLTNYTDPTGVVKDPGYVDGMAVNTTFRLQIFYRNSTDAVETWTVSLRKNDRNVSGAPQFIETVLENSQYLRAKVNPHYDGDETNFAERNLGDAKAIADRSMAASLGSGADGGGANVGDWERALGKLENSNLPIKGICDSGFTGTSGDTGSRSYQNEVGQLAARRDDCLAFVGVDEASVKGGKDAVIAYRNSLRVGDGITYTGFLGNRGYVTDEDNNREVPISGTAMFMAKWMLQWDTRQPWLPPVGPERGGMNFNRLVRDFTQDELNELAAANVNPVLIVPGEGAKVWGEYSMQTLPVPLGRLHVRTTLNYIKPPLRRALSAYIFNLNPQTGGNAVANSIREVIDAQMEGVSRNQGIDYWEVAISEDRNTARDIANRTVNVDVGIIFTETTEFVNVNIGVTPHGVSIIG